MPWFILGTSLLVGGILFLRWFISADPKSVLRVLRWVGIALAVLLAIILFVSGRFAWLWVALLALLPWISRFRMLSRLARAARGPSSGRQSRVETRFVAMTLDHDSGDMDGEVREGPYAGRRLSEMTLDELLELFRNRWRWPDDGRGGLSHPRTGARRLRCGDPAQPSRPDEEAPSGPWRLRLSRREDK
jgi:hypothetical protein